MGIGNRGRGWNGLPSSKEALSSYGQDYLSSNLPPTTTSEIAEKIKMHLVEASSVKGSCPIACDRLSFVTAPAVVHITKIPEGKIPLVVQISIGERTRYVLGLGENGKIEQRLAFYNRPTSKDPKKRELQTTVSVDDALIMLNNVAGGFMADPPPAPAPKRKKRNRARKA
jgi:hypothetical protein